MFNAENKYLRKYFLTIVFASILSSVFGIFAQDAFATDYTISDKSSCEDPSIGGTWHSLARNCHVFGFTLNSSDSLTITSGAGLYSTGTLTNEGAIYNYGKIYNDYKGGIFYNYGNITNYGTIENAYKIFNQCGGTIINEGTFTGNPVHDLCIDTDGDGIVDQLDTQPNTFSNDFSDVDNGGTITGTITTRGDQTLTVSEQPDPDAVMDTIRISPNSHLTGITFVPSNGNLYVTNFDNGDVYVIDPIQNQVTDTITVGGRPYSIAYVSSNDDVYVVDAGSNIVSVIDTTTNTVTDTITVGSAPLRVHFDSSSGNVYVSISDSSANNGIVSVIDPSTNQVIDTITGVGYGGNGVRLASSNGKLYVPSGIDGNISVIDTSTNQVIDTITGITEPNGITLSSNGNLYVSSGNTGDVSVIDTTTNEIIHTITVGGAAFDLLFLSGNVYAPTSNGISVIDTNTNEITDRISVDDLHSSFAVTFVPSTGNLYVTDVNTGSVDVVRTVSVNYVARISAALSGGLESAKVSVCGGTLSFNAGDEVIVECGSIILEGIAGQIEVAFADDSDNSANTILDAGDGVTIEPQAFSWDATSGTVEITIVSGKGTTADLSLPVDNKIQYDPIAFTLSAPHTNADVIVAIIDGQQFFINPGQTVFFQTNSPPDAGDDTAQTTINTIVTVDVLANDSDPDGDPLSVDSITIQPTHGTVTINPDNTITYTPNFAYVGSDSFDYRISDGNGGTDTALVFITVDVIAIPNIPLPIPI